MEDNIKQVEVKNKNLTNKILKTLEKNTCINYYLMEGLASDNKNYKSILYTENNKYISILHLRYEKYLHLHNFIHEKDTGIIIARIIHSTFKGLRSIFGDKKSVLPIKDSKLLHIEKSFDYTFMELDKKYFIPIKNFSNSIIIDSIKPSESHKVLPLFISYETEELGLNPERIKQEILKRFIAYKISNNELTVISKNSEVIGIAGTNAKYRNACQIGSVYIKKNFRNKGFGTQLLNYHIQKLFNSYDKIVLFVRKDNTPALKLYEKLGFKKAGELMQLILD